MNHVKKNILVIISTGIILLVVFFIFSLGSYQFIYFQKAVNSLASLTKISQNQVISGLPMRLTIPSISVDANIIQLGLAADGSVDAPKGPSDVAWFNRGPLPGTLGSSVIVGHYGQWQNGAHSVFDNLDKLKKGDKIYVKNDQGEIISFAVREIKTYNPQDIVPDIFNKSDGAHLNLITCSGTWIPGKKTYNKRLVIFADKL